MWKPTCDWREDWYIDHRCGKIAVWDNTDDRGDLVCKSLPGMICQDHGDRIDLLRRRYLKRIWRAMADEKTPIRVYVAGPYSSHPETGTNNAIDAGDMILALGFIPYVPHLSHFWDKRHPHSWETWMALDYHWLHLCNALLRLPGDSRGADQEEVWARGANIPVFYSVEELVKWADQL